MRARKEPSSEGSVPVNSLLFSFLPMLRESVVEPRTYNVSKAMSCPKLEGHVPFNSFRLKSLRKLKKQRRSKQEYRLVSQVKFAILSGIVPCKAGLMVLIALQEVTWNNQKHKGALAFQQRGRRCCTVQPPNGTQKTRFAHSIPLVNSARLKVLPTKKTHDCS